MKAYYLCLGDDGMRIELQEEADRHEAYLDAFESFTEKHRDLLSGLADDEARIREQQDDDAVTLDGDPICVGSTASLPEAYQAMRRAQIVSFAYGNLAVEHPDITRESVWAALETIESEHGKDNGDE